ncbi:MAG: OmpA family protein [Bacteroidota bacterium]
MLKIIAGSILLFLSYANISHAEMYAHLSQGDTLIKISGKVINTEDSSAIAARILYQKLPYYDDMGMASSDNESGQYEMFMVKNTKYTIEVSAQGFDKFTEEFTVEISGNSTALEKHFYISPDADNKKISLDDLRFASGSAKITSGSFRELDELADWMEERSSKIIQLEGHTDLDTRRNAKANMELSQARVESVKAYLVGKGIKKNRIRTKAFGGTQPLTRERTDEAKARNRRVEVRIIN